MPRYLVERIFVDGPQIPADAQGAEACLNVVDVNGTQGFTWIHSYVTDEGRETFCVYDGPNPGTIRATAERKACRSTGSPRYGSSTPTSTTDPGGGQCDASSSSCRPRRC
jgi:hypothetical protein